MFPLTTLQCAGYSVKLIMIEILNTVSKILEEGHLKSMRTPRRACMKRLMIVDEAKEVCRDRSVWRSVLSDYPARDKA